MKNTKIKFLSVMAALLLTTFACNAVSAQPEPTAIPTTQVISSPTPQKTNLPASEANVPRISAVDAKAAFDSGEAIIVDVRSVEAFAIEHIAGAISIPLTNFENDPASLSLDKNQWIITYCT
jgi:3-mercaptopyruvate sulfurtransferase SseA